MKLVGNWYMGDSHNYCLTEESIRSKKLVSEIKSVIYSLKNLYCEYVVIDLYEHSRDLFDRPIFFQLYKSRHFGMTDYYVVEVGIRRKTGVELYSKHKLSYDEVIKYFDRIVVGRQNIVESEWKRSKSVFGSKESKKKDEENKIALGKLKNIVDRALKYEFELDVCLEALDKILQIDLDYKYLEYFVLLYPFEKVGYQILKDMFENYSYHPIVALEMGRAEYYGKFGVPNYKKAFEYFTHAAKTGSVRADYYLGQMYRFGQYVAMDIQKYEELTKRVYDFVKENDHNGNNLPGIEDVIFELAKIERQKGNYEKSLEYCFEARENSILCSIGWNISIDLEEIEDLLYELVEFDEYDMDLFDLFYLFKKPCRAKIDLDGESIIVEAVEYNGSIIIQCEDRTYRNVKEFLENYKIKGKQITTYYADIKSIEVI